MFKNVSRIVSVIALLTIVLAACGTAATPTQAPAAPVTQVPALLLLKPSGAPALKSSSSLAEQQVAALRPWSITVLSLLPPIRARMCNTCGPTGILRR
jgi:hypothetical protein